MLILKQLYILEIFMQFKIKISVTMKTNKSCRVVLGVNLHSKVRKS